jgi:hypothetical protein
MPRISFFHGITIWMYWNEGQHQRPQFHVEYGEHLASVAFDGTVLGGNLPAPQLRSVREWAAMHQSELTANWERSQAREPSEPIAPLS